MPILTTGAFAIAAACCALVPLLLHLWQRRQPRTVRWAAMRFLEQALKRNRRLLRLRDLLLLLLRCGAVLLFGVALARPYWASDRQSVEAGQPVHAMLLLDNSVSMARQQLGVSTLDKAKARAVQFAASLPRGSRVTIMPLVGNLERMTRGISGAADDVRRALDRIEIAEQTCDVAAVIAATRRVAVLRGETDELPQRFVVFSDQQLANFDAPGALAARDDLSPIQWVAVPADATDNSWIASFTLLDSLADLATPATFSVTVRHQGLAPRDSVPVTLSINGSAVAMQQVSLPANGQQTLLFTHQFTADDLSGFLPLSRTGDGAASDAGGDSTWDGLSFLVAQASIPIDDLAQDDSRHLMVPVFAAPPILFVDGLGQEGEDPARGRWGETRYLRRLLAVDRSSEPINAATGDTTKNSYAAATGTGRRGDPESFAARAHVTIDRLNRELLRRARVVVIAGNVQPGEKGALLAEFVRQGGRLLLLAGPDWDAEAWNQGAWQHGEGVLPVPLVESRPAAELAAPNRPPTRDGETAGAELPSISPATKPPVQAVSLDFDSMSHVPFWHLPNLDEASLRELYAEPFFFGAWRVDESDEVLTQLKRAAAKDADPTRPGSEPLPEVLARFDNGAPFLLRRRIGRGEVYLATSDLYSDWNTLSKTNAVIMYDRLIRQTLADTLPPRQFEPARTIQVPQTSQLLEAGDGRSPLVVTRPESSDDPEIVETSYLDSLTRGWIVPYAFVRGVYAIHHQTGNSTGAIPSSAVPASSSYGSAVTMRYPGGIAPGPAALLLAVTPTERTPHSESDLRTIEAAEFQRRMAGLPWSWVGPSETISIAGGNVRGSHSWWYFAVIALAALLGEMLVVQWAQRRFASESAAPVKLAELLEGGVRQDERPGARSTFEATASKAAVRGSPGAVP